MMTIHKNNKTPIRSPRRSPRLSAQVSTGLRTRQTRRVNLEDNDFGSNTEDESQVQDPPPRKRYKKSNANLINTIHQQHRVSTQAESNKDDNMDKSPHDKEGRRPGSSKKRKLSPTKTKQSSNSNDPSILLLEALLIIRNDKTCQELFERKAQMARKNKKAPNEDIRKFLLEDGASPFSDKKYNVAKKILNAMPYHLWKRLLQVVFTETFQSWLSRDLRRNNFGNPQFCEIAKLWVSIFVSENSKLDFFLDLMAFFAPVYGMQPTGLSMLAIAQIEHDKQQRQQQQEQLGGRQFVSYIDSTGLDEIINSEAYKLFHNFACHGVKQQGENYITLENYVKDNMKKSRKASKLQPEDIVKPFQVVAVRSVSCEHVHLKEESSSYFHACDLARDEERQYVRCNLNSIAPLLCNALLKISLSCFLDQEDGFVMDADMHVEQFAQLLHCALHHENDEQRFLAEYIDNIQLENIPKSSYEFLQLLKSEHACTKNQNVARAYRHRKTQPAKAIRELEPRSSQEPSVADQPENGDNLTGNDDDNDNDDDEEEAEEVMDDRSINGDDDKIMVNEDDALSDTSQIMAEEENDIDSDDDDMFVLGETGDDLDSLGAPIDNETMEDDSNSGVGSSVEDLLNKDNQNMTGQEAPEGTEMVDDSNNEADDVFVRDDGNNTSQNDKHDNASVQKGSEDTGMIDGNNNEIDVSAIYGNSNNLQSENNSSVSIEDASIRIQRIRRGFLVRRDLTRFNHAALIIQCLQRSMIARQTLFERKALAQQKSLMERQSQATATIQMAFRNCIRRRQESQATTTIQEAFRSYRRRRQQRQRQEQLQAAKILQRFARGLSTQQRHRLEERSSVLIQKVWRGYAQSYQFKILMLALMTLQMAYRQFRDKRRSAAIDIIQRVWRGSQARKAICRLNIAAMVIQSSFRGFNGRVCISKLCLTTINIQRVWRGSQARKVICDWNKAARGIQRCFRGLKGRTYFFKCRLATIEIQKVWRGSSQRKAVCRNIAASRIQRLCCEFRAKRHFQAAQIMQTSCRSFVARGSFRRLRSTTIKVQRAWRSEQLAGKENITAAGKTLSLQVLIKASATTVTEQNEVVRPDPHGLNLCGTPHRDPSLMKENMPPHRNGTTSFDQSCSTGALRVLHSSKSPDTQDSRALSSLTEHEAESKDGRKNVSIKDSWWQVPAEISVVSYRSRQAQCTDFISRKSSDQSNGIHQEELDGPVMKTFEAGEVFRGTLHHGDTLVPMEAESRALKDNENVSSNSSKSTSDEIGNQGAAYKESHGTCNKYIGFVNGGPSKASSLIIRLQKVPTGPQEYRDRMILALIVLQRFGRAINRRTLAVNVLQRFGRAIIWRQAHFVRESGSQNTA